MKKLSLLNLFYFTIIIIFLALQYNEWFFNLFHPDWMKFSEKEKFWYFANNYFWIWFTLNISMIFFIIFSIIFKYYKNWKVLIWQLFIVVIVGLSGIFMPFIYATFNEWLSWSVYSTIFLICIFWVAYSYFVEKKALHIFDEPKSQTDIKERINE